jgi:hypothetical protein
MYSLARNEFIDLLCGTVHIFVSVGELCAELVRVALDLARPPSTNIVDRIEGLLGRLVYRKARGEIFRFHELFLSSLVALLSLAAESGEVAALN